MRSSILCLALAGLASIAQATPVTNTAPAAAAAAHNPEPRSLLARGFAHVFLPREASTPSEPPPTKRQATAPPPAKTTGGGGGAVNNANRTVTLIVQRGDTLGQIARQFNSGICDIAKLSNVPNPDFIDVGQVLTIPVNVAKPDNESCLQRGGAIPAAPPPANGTAGAAPPAAAPPPPADKGKDGKKNKRRRSVGLLTRGQQQHGRRAP